ncbi:hypothetical protein [Xaviernesmea oryzae]|uniref:hypothetical protein n=1 Tax=Xaviernesmea oryzae TaxID=464029 RepID=UPI001115282E|nr:hypothetical protein [Xaviernesmea oryzae]
MIIVLSLALDVFYERKKVCSLPDFGSVACFVTSEEKMDPDRPVLHGDRRLLAFDGYAGSPSMRKGSSGVRDQAFWFGSCLSFDPVTVA